MEEDRKKQELRAKEMDVKEDEGILYFYTKFCATKCIIVLIKRIKDFFFNIRLLFLVLTTKRRNLYHLEDVDVDKSYTETVSRMFQQEDEELSGMIGASSWDSDHE